MRTYAATSPALTPGGTVLAGAPWTTATNANSMKLRNADFNGLRDNGDGVDTLILPPGDYYFTDIDVSGNNRIIMDTAGLTTGTPGMVRIWMDDPLSAHQSDDTINLNVVYTSTDPSRFRLYYNKCTTLTIAGNSTYNGGFYAVRPPGCQGDIVVTGGSVINGSVIASYVTISGGSAINFPSEPIDNPDDFSLWYGFRDQWQELPPAGGVLFPDGTTK